MTLTAPCIASWFYQIKQWIEEVRKKRIENIHVYNYYHNYQQAIYGFFFCLHYLETSLMFVFIFSNVLWVLSGFNLDQYVLTLVISNADKPNASVLLIPGSFHCKSYANMSMLNIINSYFCVLGSSTCVDLTSTFSSCPLPWSHLRTQCSISQKRRVELLMILLLSFVGLTAFPWILKKVLILSHEQEAPTYTEPLLFLLLVVTELNAV